MSHDSLPSCLYHYTDQRGFLGILNSGELWASSIRHLNDESEFKYATRIAQDFVFGGPDNEAGTEAMIDVVVTEMMKIFVVSFSEMRDQLGQWRAYCRDGGFCIAFDRSRLVEVAASQDFTLEQCSYEKEEHERELKVLVENSMSRTPKTVRAHLSNALIERAPTMKHPSFREEREWRLVSREYPKGIIPATRQTFYREGRSFPIPHQKLQLKTGEGKIAAIAEVVIGPGPHKSLIAQTTNDFLSDLGLDVPVAESDAPYRNW